jgi:hypothetical protein
MAQGLDSAGANPVHQNGRIQDEIPRSARLMMKCPDFGNPVFSEQAGCW